MPAYSCILHTAYSIQVDDLDAYLITDEKLKLQNEQNTKYNTCIGCIGCIGSVYIAGSCDKSSVMENKRSRQYNTLVFKIVHDVVHGRKLNTMG